MSKASILPHLCHMCPVWSTLQSLRETPTPGCYSPTQGNLGAWLSKCRFAGDESSQLLCLCNCPYFGFIFEGYFCWIWSWLQNSGLKGLSYSSLRKSFYWILPVNSTMLQGIGCLPQFWSFVAAFKIFVFLLVLRNLRIAPLGLFPSFLLNLAFLGSLDLWAVSIKSGHTSALTSANIFPPLFVVLPFEIPATGMNTAWSYYTDHGYSCCWIIFLSLYFLLVGPLHICPPPCLFWDAWYHCSIVCIHTIYAYTHI